VPVGAYPAETGRLDAPQGLKYVRSVVELFPDSFKLAANGKTVFQGKK